MEICTRILWWGTSHPKRFHIPRNVNSVQKSLLISSWDRKPIKLMLHDLRSANVDVKLAPKWLHAQKVHFLTI